MIFSLDVQSTAALDVDLETERQNMFIKAIKLLVKRLRVKRDISTEQECNVSNWNYTEQKPSRHKFKMFPRTNVIPECAPAESQFTISYSNDGVHNPII